MKTLIENAIVLTMDDEMRVFDRGYVLTDGVHIAEVGAGLFCRRRRRADRCARRHSAPRICEHALPCVDGAVPHDGR